MKIIKLPYKNNIETLWESKNKNKNGDAFISIKKCREYYVYAERAGKDSIAFILYDKDTQKYGLIKESKPPLDGVDYKAYLITAFGGSIDMNATAQEICQIEVEEEAGYEVPLEKITFLGETFVSTQMSQMCKLFVVDVTGIAKTKIAEWEESDTLEPNEMRVIWMNKQEVMENMDWKSVFVLGQIESRRMV